MVVNTPSASTISQDVGHDRQAEGVRRHQERGGEDS